MRGFEHSDTEAVVVFVDMSGFTALTETHGDHHAARLAEAFAVLARAALEPGDELIKTIGDAVMVTCRNAEAALGFLHRLNEATHDAGGFPMLRAGVGAGPVVKRRNDVYGATVNIAARFAALAAPGEVVATADVAAAARRHGLSVAQSGPLSLRNIGAPVDAVTIDIGTDHGLHVDPVCRMHVAADVRQPTVTHEGQQYRFCSATCARQFASRPDDYAPRRSRSHTAR